MATIEHLSRDDSRQILKSLNEYGRILIVRQRKNGRLRFFDPEKYFAKKVRMREVIRQHKPWAVRQKQGGGVLGPIGSKALGVQEDLSRTAIYEGR